MRLWKRSELASAAMVSGARLQSLVARSNVTARYETLEASELASAAMVSGANLLSFVAPPLRAMKQRSSEQASAASLGAGDADPVGVKYPIS